MTMVAAMSNILHLGVDRVGDDEELQIEHLEILDAEIKLHREDQNRDAATSEDDLYGDEVVFYDQHGHVRGNLLQIAFAVSTGSRHCRSRRSVRAVSASPRSSEIPTAACTE